MSLFLRIRALAFVSAVLALFLGIASDVEAGRRPRKPNRSRPRTEAPARRGPSDFSDSTKRRKARPLLPPRAASERTASRIRRIAIPYDPSALSTPRSHFSRRATARQTEDGRYESLAGLIYPDRAWLEELVQTWRSEASFRGDLTDLIGLLDEAYLRTGAPETPGRGERIRVADMERVLGRAGGVPASHIRLTLRPDGNVVSATLFSNGQEAPRPSPRRVVRRTQDRGGDAPNRALMSEVHRVDPVLAAAVDTFGMVTPARATLDTPNDHLFFNEQARFLGSYNRDLRVVNWTLHILTSRDFSESGGGGKADFGVSPRLPSHWPQSSAKSFSGSPFERSHLIGRGDRDASVEAARATFTMGENVVPALQEHNQGPWNDFEVELRRLAIEEHQQIAIFQGPIFQGTIPRLRGVAVPTAMWKVAFVLPRGQSWQSVDGNTRVMSIIVPNTEGSVHKAQSWREFTTSVEDIIRQADLPDLLAGLPPAVRNELITGIYGDRLPPSPPDPSREPQGERWRPGVFLRTPEPGDWLP